MSNMSKMSKVPSKVSFKRATEILSEDVDNDHNGSGSASTTNTFQAVTKSYDLFCRGGSVRLSGTTEIKVGDNVKLKREPNNKYDPNAIKVEQHDEENYWYLSREQAAILAPLIDSNKVDIENVQIKNITEEFDVSLEATISGEDITNTISSIDFEYSKDPFFSNGNTKSSFELAFKDRKLARDLKKDAPEEILYGRLYFHTVYHNFSFQKYYHIYL